METGVIKFTTRRLGPAASEFSGLDELNHYREKLIRTRLLGRDEHGVGFGNVSLRSPGETGFYITASGVGDRAILNPNDVVQVTSWDFSTNLVEFRGTSDPSSESLTHAAVYESDETIHAVIHPHQLSLWQRLLAAGEATSGSAEYGTPAMANAVKEFVIARRGRPLLFAMNGHEGGLLCCGPDLESMCSRLLAENE